MCAVRALQHGQSRSTRCSRIDAITLPQQGELALGTLGAQEWVNDLPNEQNKRYVADFKKKHNVYPSYYGAQSYDAIMLIASAAEALKGDLSNKDKVRAELKKANFKSLRGDFKYNTNHFPIQNFYIQEAVKDPGGMMTVKTIATAVTDGQGSVLREVPDEVRPDGFNGSVSSERSEGSWPVTRSPAVRIAVREAKSLARVIERMDYLLVQVLNGVQLGLLMFLLAAGLTLHLRHHGPGEPGARLALHDGRLHRLDASSAGPTPSSLGALLALPATFLLGVVVEAVVMRRLYARDHLDQVLATFGLILFFNELVRAVWGPAGKSIAVPPPSSAAPCRSCPACPIPPTASPSSWSALVVARSCSPGWWRAPDSAC